MPRFRNFDDLNTHLEACCAKRWADNCVATTRRSANAWNGIVRFFRPSRIAYDACDKRPGRVMFAVAGALSRHRLLRPHTVRPLPGAGPRLCPRGGHQLRRRGDCQAPAFIRARTSSSIRCTICPCWSKSQRAGSGGSLAGWPAGLSSAISAAYLKRGWAKPGSGNTSRSLRLIESFSLDDVRAAISEALERGVIGFDAVKHLVLCRIEKRPPRLMLGPANGLSAARRGATTSARSSHGAPEVGAAP